MCIVQVFSKESELEIATGRVLKSIAGVLEIPVSDLFYNVGPLKLEEIDGFLKGVTRKLRDLSEEFGKVILMNLLFC